MVLSIRAGKQEDIAAIHPVIERAYRGDSARLGWTHEADLLSGERINRRAIETIVDDPRQRLLIALDDDQPLGCVNIAKRDDGSAYLGLVCIEPRRQAGGIGRRLIAAAEETARVAFRCNRIEMTVIDRRVELIAYYERRGYAQTGERRDFPAALEPPLFFTVLAKCLT